MSKESIIAAVGRYMNKEAKISHLAKCSRCGKMRRVNIKSGICPKCKWKKEKDNEV